MNHASRMDYRTGLDELAKRRKLAVEPLFCGLSAHTFARNVWAGVVLNPLKPELNPICYLLALLGAHHFLHVSRIRVKLLTLR